jgi:L-alanine-DL-glutamate epimerase-like enolase superfamily enzyme
MKITRIACTPVTFPMRTTLAFASGQMAASEHVLVQVHTDEGLTGTAEAPSRPYLYGESQRSMIAAVERWFAPVLIGADPFAIETAWEALDRVAHNNTVKGALDLALHDIIGQALGVPCHRLLGGYATSARVTYVCGHASPAVMQEEALAVAAEYGIDAFKLKVGLDPLADAEMIVAMRRALPHALLYLDGNEAFRAQDAIRLLRVAEANGIAWVEEPCAVADRAGRRQVARVANVPILGDESCQTVEQVGREIADGTVHMVSIKLARTGYRNASAILGACAAARVRPMVGSQGDSGVGVLAALHFCVAHRATQALPAELSFFLNLGSDLLAEPLTIRAGRLEASGAPGLGIAIDPDKLARCRVDG